MVSIVNLAVEIVEHFDPKESSLMHEYATKINKIVEFMQRSPAGFVPEGTVQQALLLQRKAVSIAAQLQTPPLNYEAIDFITVGEYGVSGLELISFIERAASSVSNSQAVHGPSSIQFAIDGDRLTARPNSEFFTKESQVRVLVKWLEAFTAVEKVYIEYRDAIHSMNKIAG